MAGLEGLDAFFIELIDSTRVTYFRLFAANDREFRANFMFMNIFSKFSDHFKPKCYLKREKYKWKSSLFSKALFCHFFCKHENASFEALQCIDS